MVQHTRKKTIRAKKLSEAVAVINTDKIQGEITAKPYKSGIQISAHFTKLPKGKHGFHIHKAGDLRGEGCRGLCEHYDKSGKNNHGGTPGQTRERHTGDLGNIEISPKKTSVKKNYYIKNMSVRELWGRSIIIHADEDDLGKGPHEDSKVTGHSGARIGCAIFGRSYCSKQMTRKH
jgi:Cu-Zn family superoxide dismutase